MATFGVIGMERFEIGSTAANNPLSSVEDRPACLRMRTTMNGSRVV